MSNHGWEGWASSDGQRVQVRRILEPGIRNFYTLAVALGKASATILSSINRGGRAEQWIKEGKNAVKWTKLSCRTFKDNQTRLQLFALAYNLPTFCVGWPCPVM